MAGSIGIEVFLSPNKPFNGASKSWDPGRQSTWPASTATLVEGENDAILVDGLMILAEGQELLSWIRRTGKRLTATCVTHAQADYFFGLEPVLDAFPDAKLVTLDVIASATAEQADNERMTLWNSFIPGQITAARCVVRR